MTSSIRPKIDDYKQTPPNKSAEAEAKILMASQWTLMWRKFRKHRLAMLGGTVTILIYLVVLFAEFLAPFPSAAFSSEFPYGPPQPLHLFDRTPEGLRFSPYVNGYSVTINQEALKREFTVDQESKIPVRLFVHGTPYKLLGLFDTDLHLIGPVEYDQDPLRIVTPMYLMGADRLGRDVLSRIIHGTRISMTIGLIGVALSFLIGLTLGGVSGFYGGTVDNMIQRAIELLRSIPTTPLWMGLAAALPSSCQASFPAFSPGRRCRTFPAGTRHLAARPCQRPEMPSLPAQTRIIR